MRFYNVRMTLTRRQWAALVSASPLVAQVVPSTPAPQTAASLSPAQKMEKANADVRDVSQSLAAIDLPLGVEPAFIFIV
jgi:hypothetical protein